MLSPHPCRQPATPNQLSKRWFSDMQHDLFVWLTVDGQITAFQFSYNKCANEHLLSWSAAYGYSHDRIDDGENSPFQTMSPIMVPDDAVDSAQVAESFRSVSELLEPEIVEFIYSKLRAYGSSQCA